MAASASKTHGVRRKGPAVWFASFLLASVSSAAFGAEIWSGDWGYYAYVFVLTLGNMVFPSVAAAVIFFAVIRTIAHPGFGVRVALAIGSHVAVAMLLFGIDLITSTEGQDVASIFHNNYRGWLLWGAVAAASLAVFDRVTNHGQTKK